ncbi:MAG: hypothetical protein E7347_04545, partial [Clostridiales bacterium]|nr:hypothetical protein [Clostridiales bacterium]
MKFTKKRITTMVVAMLSLVALCFSMVACSTPTTDENSNTANTPTQETILAGGMQVGETQSQGIKLMSAKLLSEDFATYGISPLAETAITINA